MLYFSIEFKHIKIHKLCKLIYEMYSTVGLQIDCCDNICTYNECGRKAEVNQVCQETFKREYNVQL